MNSISRELPILSANLIPNQSSITGERFKRDCYLFSGEAKFQTESSWAGLAAEIGEHTALHKTYHLAQVENMTAASESPVSEENRLGLYDMFILTKLRKY